MKIAKRIALLEVNLTPKQQRKAEALEEYDKITASALKEYDKITDPALKAYKKIRDPAWEEYQRKVKEIDKE